MNSSSTEASANKSKFISRVVGSPSEAIVRVKFACGFALCAIIWKGSFTPVASFLIRVSPTILQYLGKFFALKLIFSALLSDSN